MFGGNFAGMYFDAIIGAVGYAITLTLLGWHRYGWAHMKQALPRYVLALPLSLVVSTILFAAYFLLGVTLFNTRR